MSKISVILPKITDEDKFVVFCNSLFANEIETELLVCNHSNINTDNFTSDKIIFSDEITLNNAINISTGDFIIISDENAIYSNGALSVLASNADNSACACNVSDINGKLFIDNFSLDELSTRTVYCNHLLRKNVIVTNNICILSDSEFGIMNFLSDYYRYDDFKAINETLINIELKNVSFDKKDTEILKPYCEAFSACEKINVILFFIRNAFTFFSDDNEVILKVILYYFKNNDYVNAWVKAKYNVDIVTIIKDNNINLSVDNIYLKEVKMPLLADDIVKEFRMGKQGSATLKKCIVAYADYNIYIQKGNRLTQFIFKLIRKILGGDDNE